ncbi:hypothetical protein MA16_Dca026296 [Dendrobium catenatum]|uniref:Uncharacterized protein n=1 Tax=Dendrobium catenatum TaxID=906689 RepID=A0A2I0V8U0_9ASPA|nr:hypothetical protein MA16_Dca026296 [Dendrobium catenatum]
MDREALKVEDSGENVNNCFEKDKSPKQIYEKSDVKCVEGFDANEGGSSLAKRTLAKELKSLGSAGMMAWTINIGQHLFRAMFRTIVLGFKLIGQDNIVLSLEVSERSTLAIDQGSLPASGGSKRSWVLYLTGVGEKEVAWKLLEVLISTQGKRKLRELRRRQLLHLFLHLLHSTSTLNWISWWSDSTSGRHYLRPMLLCRSSNILRTLLAFDFYVALQQHQHDQDMT